MRIAVMSLSAYSLTSVSHVLMLEKVSFLVMS